LTLSSRKSRLKNDTTLPFDRLLIASGASVKKPSLERIDLDNVFTLRTLDDAERIKVAFPDCQGDDLLWCGTSLPPSASQLYRKRLKMTFLVSSDQILSQNLNLEGSRIVQHRIEKMGPSFLFNRDIKSIEKRKRTPHITTSQNEDAQRGLCFYRKGVTPNIRFAQGRLETNKGILVNERLQNKSQSHLCCRGCDRRNQPFNKTEGNHCEWQMPVNKGKIAGLNMIVKRRPLLISSQKRNPDL